MPEASKDHSLTGNWLPSLTALAVLAGALLYTRGLPALGLRHLTFLAISFTWAAIALSLRAAAGDELVALRLRSLTPRKWLILIPVLTVFGYLAFDDRINFNFVPLAGLALHLCLASKRPAFAFASLGFLGLLTLGMSEGTLTLIRRTPSLVQVDALEGLVRALYKSDWNVLQFLPECTRFDEELGYTMHPGGCRFANTEFTTTINVNSLGLRDDEDSLHRPELIALGDSYTVGWGVEGAESYPSRLEQMSGLRVLNAGIATYGTAREVALLARLDCTHLKYLTVQYCGNDFGENREFQRRGRLPRLTRSAFDSLIAQHRRTHRFVPWRYTYAAYRHWAAGRLAVLLNESGWPAPARNDFQNRGERDPEETTRRVRREVEAFLYALESSPVPLTNVHVVLTLLGGSPEFLPLLEQTLAASPGRIPAASVRVVDMESRLDSSHRFPLDPHLNARGNQAAAEILLRELHETETVVAPEQTGAG